MKSIFHRRNLALLIVLTGFLAHASAGQPAPGPGVPGGAPLQIDQATGAPIAIPEIQWKDANWKDPATVLAEVNFDNLPLGEVARNVSDRFKDEFDILLPHGQSGVELNLQTGIAVTATDWQRDIPIQLRLKNVTASEIFNAMNLLFENDKTPLRWELKVNGRRQLALLRVLTQPVWKDEPQIPPPQPIRKVYFVGDLLGDSNTPGMTMDQIVTTIREVYETSGGSRLMQMQIHRDAQLLIVTDSGKGDGIDFVEQTLRALHLKLNMERAKKAEMKTDEAKPKSGANAGSR